MKTIAAQILSFIQKLDNSKAATVIKALLLNLANIVTYIETPNAVAPDLVPTGEALLDKALVVLMGLAEFDYPSLSQGIKDLIYEIGTITKQVLPDYTSAIGALEDILDALADVKDTASTNAALHVANAISVLRGTASAGVQPLAPQKAPSLEKGQVAIPGLHVDKPVVTVKK